MRRIMWGLGVVAVMVLCLSSLCSAGTPEEAAMRAAKEAVRANGIIVDSEARFIYDPSNKLWEERVATIEQLPADPNHGKLPHGVLRDKKYETVMLDFKEGAKEADTWVFVDKNTGNVIALYQEKR